MGLENATIPKLNNALATIVEARIEEFQTPRGKSVDPAKFLQVDLTDDSLKILRHSIGIGYNCSSSSFQPPLDRDEHPSVLYALGGVI